MAIGIEPVVVKTVFAIREHPAKTTTPKDPAAAQPKLRSGTKQAALISMLRTADGATIEEIMTATGWQSHPGRDGRSTKEKARPRGQFGEG